VEPLSQQDAIGVGLPQDAVGVIAALQVAEQAFSRIVPVPRDADIAPDPEPSTDSILVLGLVGLVCLVLVAAAVTVVLLVLRRRR